MKDGADDRTTRALLLELGISSLQYEAALAGCHGDAEAALLELLWAALMDPYREPHARKTAAVHLVAFEPKRERKGALQKAIHQLELAELAHRGVTDAVCVGLNPDCLGCAGAHNKSVSPRDPDSVAKFPPASCLHIQQGHACCLIFAPRIVSAKTLF